MKFKIIGFVAGLILCVPGIIGFEQLTGKHGYAVVVPMAILVTSIFFLNSWHAERKIMGRWLLWGAIASFPVSIVFFLATWDGKMC